MTSFTTKINNLTVSATTYSPLFLKGEGWSLDFRSTPDPKVIFLGREPSYEEIGKTLMFCGFPIIFIDVIQVIIKDKLCYH